MTWNYRILKKRSKDGSWHYGVHEVFYNESSEPIAFTEDPISPYGTSHRELVRDLEYMRRDILNTKAIDVKVLEKKLQYFEGEG